MRGWIHEFFPPLFIIAINGSFLAFLVNKSGIVSRVCAIWCNLIKFKWTVGPLQKYACYSHIILHIKS